jgi:peroxiredoxin Q/BCP
MANDLQIGDAAPHFRTMAVGADYGSGREVSLNEFRGQPLVLYFYPKDDTPGCTAQACGLRDNWEAMKHLAKVFGISTDSPESHSRFVEKYQLPFPLLSDSDKQMVNAYHVWIEKNFMGKKSMGVERTTFVIDGEGRISAIFRKVRPERHVDLLREALGGATH